MKRLIAEGRVIFGDLTHVLERLPALPPESAEEFTPLARATHKSV
jgi:hypothetical protein